MPRPVALSCAAAILLAAACAGEPLSRGWTLAKYAAQYDELGSAKVINGAAVESPGRAPFMAQLSITSSAFPLGSAVCGGTLIAPSAVLTAAHCLCAENKGTTPLPNLKVKVLLGSLVFGGGTAFSAEYVAVHPAYAYDGNMPVNDLALVLLSSNVSSSVATPVPLDAYNTASSANFSAALVMGWGLTAPGGTLPVAQLQYAGVSRVPDAKCTLFAREEGAKNDTEAALRVCANGATKGANGLQADTCTGDSGGPLLLQTPGPASNWYKDPADASAVYGLGCCPGTAEPYTGPQIGITR